MRKTTPEEFKKIEYNILCFIDEVCKKLGIKFFLGFGSALGAVRHGGFIPWDDDIDVVFFRKDYEIFEKYMIQYKGNDYKLLSINADKKFDYCFPKLTDIRTSMSRSQYRSKASIGAYIDIFILDNVPSDEKLKRKLLKKQKKLTVFWNLSMWNHMGGNKSPFKVFIKTFIRLIPARTYAKLINKNAKKYNDVDTEYVQELTYYGNAIKTKERCWFGEGVKMKFEDAEYLVPVDYDKYLTNLYRNYMTLPPVEKRVNKHENFAYIIDDKCLEPYKNHFEDSI